MQKPKNRLRPRINATVSPLLLTQLDARNDNRSAVIELTLRRAFDTYDYERIKLAQLFDQKDIEQIVAAARPRLETEPDLMLSQEFTFVAGRIADQDLQQRLFALSQSARMALFDTIERWWHAVGHAGREPEHEQFFAFNGYMPEA